MGQRQQTNAQRQQQGFGIGQTQWSVGATRPDWGETEGTSSNLEIGALAGWQDAQRRFEQQQQQQAAFASMFESLQQPQQSQGPSYEQQQQDYDARIAAERTAQGRRDRDSAYSSYLDAANSAAEFVTGEIAREQSNADLLGIDYSVSDEQKSTRINDYFATIWGAGQQSGLENLMKKFGNPQGFTEFSVSRGDATKYGSVTQPSETIATSRGQKPTVLASEDDTLGTTAVLGG